MAKLQLNPFKVIMAQVRQVIYDFNYVANAPTQFFQRDTFPAITASIKAKGRKSIFKVNLESRYNPAIHPKTGERGKHSARVFLNLLASQKIRDKSIMPTYNGLLIWCAAKIVTSRARSLEGALMSQVFNTLESGGGKLLSMKIRDTEYSREDVLARRDDLLLNLEVSIEHGTIKQVAGRKSLAVESDITL